MNINDAMNVLNISSKSTQKEIKAAYKAACLKYHPDRNPAGNKMMVVINAAYDSLKKLGDTVTPTDDFNSNDYGDELNIILNSLLEIEGLIIEVCGNWVWISGETKPHSEKLGRKGLGCFWAKKKKMWYYRPSNYKSTGRGTWTIDDIRAAHGTEKIKKESPKKILTH